MSSRVTAGLRAAAGRLVAALLAGGVLVGLVWLLVVVRRALPDESAGNAGSLTAPTFAAPPAASGVARVLIPDTLLGRSRALRFVALTPAEAEAVPGLVATFGDSILRTARTLTVQAGADPFTLFTLRGFGQKRGEMLGAYRLGLWPAERWMMGANYLNPDGFVEVWPANADTPLSEHFRLGDFVMKDRQVSWPKYLALEERLVDKLELVLDELEARGVGASRVVVLSGFRAPYYNDLQVDEGAARASRHQYGDAADILIDHDGDGAMDDLNGDRRRDLSDANVIGAAVAAVERRFPELRGGLGTYAAMGPSGPFAHVDVRGTSARWERARGARGDTLPVRRR